MPTAGEYKSVIGLRDLYIAEITQDDSAGYATGVPQKLAPAVEATVSFGVNTETQYADDGPFDVVQSEGVSEIKIKVTSIPAEIQALIFGQALDTANGLVYDDATPENAPYFALGFRAAKANGKYRYFWYLKGRFSRDEEAFATRSDSPEPKEPEIVFTAVLTEHEFADMLGNTRRRKRVWGDEDLANFDPTGWFSSVKTPVSL